MERRLARSRRNGIDADADDYLGSKHLGSQGTTLLRTKRTMMCELKRRLARSPGDSYGRTPSHARDADLPFRGGACRLS
jgi:hypothetical protein